MRKGLVIDLSVAFGTPLSSPSLQLTLPSAFSLPTPSSTLPRKTALPLSYPLPSSPSVRELYVHGLQITKTSAISGGSITLRARPESPITDFLDYAGLGTTVGYLYWYGYHVPAVRKRDLFYAKLEEKREGDTTTL